MESTTGTPHERAVIGDAMHQWNLTKFRPFSQCVYWMLYYIPISAMLIMLLNPTIRLYFEFYPHVGSPWHLPVLLVIGNSFAFACMFFFIAYPGRVENEAGILWPFIFSLALTSPIFFTAGYFFYVLWICRQ